jgi:hypothetical protein
LVFSANYCIITSPIWEYNKETIPNFGKCFWESKNEVEISKLKIGTLFGPTLSTLYPKNNQDIFPIKNFLQFVLLRKKYTPVAEMFWVADFSLEIRVIIKMLFDA